MVILMLCIALWSSQTTSVATMPTKRLPTQVYMMAIIEVDQPPVRLEMLTVRWEHDGRPVAEYKNQNPIFHDPRAQMPLEQFKDGNISLVLSDITVSDSGNYTCHIQYEEQRETVQYRLIIETHRLQLLNLSTKKTAAPVDEVKPFLSMVGKRVMNTSPGKNVTLQCRFQTDKSMELPMLTIRWSKDGVTKWFYDGTSQNNQEHLEKDLEKGWADLSLGPVEEEDGGTYICTIKYKSLENSYKTVLNVRDGALLTHASTHHPHQSDVPASINTTDEHWTTKIALVCVAVVSTYFFVFIIFCFIP